MRPASLQLSRSTPGIGLAKCHGIPQHSHDVVVVEMTSDRAKSREKALGLFH